MPGYNVNVCWYCNLGICRDMQREWKSRRDVERHIEDSHKIPISQQSEDMMSLHEWTTNPIIVENTQSGRDSGSSAVSDIVEVSHTSSHSNTSSCVKQKRHSATPKGSVGSTLSEIKTSTKSTTSTAGKLVEIGKCASTRLPKKQLVAESSADGKRRPEKAKTRSDSPIPRRKRAKALNINVPRFLEKMDRMESSDSKKRKREDTDVVWRKKRNEVESGKAAESAVCDVFAGVAKIDKSFNIRKSGVTYDDTDAYKNFASSSEPNAKKHRIESSDVAEQKDRNKAETPKDAESAVCETTKVDKAMQMRQAEVPDDNENTSRRVTMLKRSVARSHMKNLSISDLVRELYRRIG